MTDEEWIEELHRELLREYPDPVDILEDRLAAQLGIYRHPFLPLEAWRRLRVRVINQATP